MKVAARKQQQSKFKEEDAIAPRAPRPLDELGRTPDAEIFGPGMRFATRAEAELNAAELCEKHRKQFHL